MTRAIRPVTDAILEHRLPDGEGDDHDDDGYHQEQAEQERNAEDTMLYLSLFLVIALALLTLARLGKTTASRLILAVPGWLCLAGGIIALVVAEV